MASISLGFAVVQFVVIFLVHAYATMRRLKMCNKYCPRQFNNTHKYMHQTERPHPIIVAPSGPGEDRYNLLESHCLNLKMNLISNNCIILYFQIVVNDIFW